MSLLILLATTPDAAITYCKSHRYPAVLNACMIIAKQFELLILKT